MKRNWGFLVSFFVILMVSISFSASMASAGEQDLEWWSWVGVSYDLKKVPYVPEGTAFKAEYNHRMDRDMEHTFYQNFTLGLEFKLPGMEGWTFAPYYRHVEAEPGRDEDRYYFDLGKTWKDLCDTKLELKTRARLDVRNFDGRDDTAYRFRPYAELNHPIGFKIKDKDVKMYISGEPFYDWDVDRWNRVRLNTGLRLPVTKEATVTVGYQTEINYMERLHDWDFDHMLMTGLNYKF